MKTITITINISEETQQPLTIKSSIQEQINFHLKQKKLSNRLILDLKSKAIDLLQQLKVKLNESVGEDVWVNRQNRLEIGFASNIVRAEFSSEKITFGNIEYYKPSIESLKIEVIYLNGSGYSYLSKPFESIEQVNEIAKKDYIKHFTKKL